MGMVVVVPRPSHMAKVKDFELPEGQQQNFKTLCPSKYSKNGKHTVFSGLERPGYYPKPSVTSQITSEWVLMPNKYYSKSRVRIQMWKSLQNSGSLFKKMIVDYNGIIKSIPQMIWIHIYMYIWVNYNDLTATSL